jgi:ABC-2 type transport system permease protein
MRSLTNIYRLGVKELWSVARDPMMIALIIFAFTLSIYSSARSAPDTLFNAPIAIVDEDNSPLSARIASAFFPPQLPSAGDGVTRPDRSGHGSR